MFILATNGNSLLLIANEILVGNSGFRGFAHAKRGYISYVAECILNGRGGNPIARNGLDVNKIKIGNRLEPLKSTAEF